LQPWRAEAKGPAQRTPLSGLAMRRGGPQGQTEQNEQSEILRRAEQTCEPQSVAPQQSCGGPKKIKTEKLLGTLS